MNLKDLSSYTQKHINYLGIKKNDNVVIHADISSFGIYNKKLAFIIINNILKKIGKNGTIAFPLYNTSLDKKRIINLKKDFGKKENSILSIFFFKNFKYIKTNSVFHSHLIKGKLENIFKKNINFQSFGKKSDFDLFHKYDFKLLLLGCDASQGCTYLHHIENKKEKKYRLNKKFKLKIKFKEKIFSKTINYGVRKNNVLMNFNKIFFLPQVKKITKKRDLKLGASYSLKLREFDKICSKIIEDNPGILLA